MNGPTALGMVLAMLVDPQGKPVRGGSGKGQLYASRGRARRPAADAPPGRAPPGRDGGAPRVGGASSSRTCSPGRARPRLWIAIALAGGLLAHPPGAAARPRAPAARGRRARRGARPAGRSCRCRRLQSCGRSRPSPRAAGCAGLRGSSSPTARSRSTCPRSSTAPRSRRSGAARSERGAAPHGARRWGRVTAPQDESSPERHALVTARGEAPAPDR